MAPVLSVIIPTRNRAALLQKTVDLLLAEAGAMPGQVEIVIVDDGSSADERTAMRCYLDGRGPGSQGIVYLEQAASGPARARNQGIAAASGRLVLFTGDDILPCPGLLHAHIQTHCERYPEEYVAVLGLADLAPEFQRPPFVHWWRHWNFRYDALLSGRRQPDCGFFFTNNLSLKRDYLLKYGLFDEAFPAAAYEDIELGYRLSRHGLQIVFVPEAQAYHYHRIDLATACHRMEMRGRYYDLFYERTHYPAISRIWAWLGSGPWMQRWLIYPLWRLADKTQNRCNLGPIYIWVLMYFYLAGRGLRPPLLRSGS